MSKNRQAEELSTNKVKLKEDKSQQKSSNVSLHTHTHVIIPQPYQYNIKSHSQLNVKKQLNSIMYNYRNNKQLTKTNRWNKDKITPLCLYTPMNLYSSVAVKFDLL